MNQLYPTPDGVTPSGPTPSERAATQRPASAAGAFGALVLTLAACGGSNDASVAPTSTRAAADPATPAASPDGPTMTASSSRETFDIAITPKGGPIPLNEPFQVELLVTEHATGEPLTEFDAITLDARMPAHDHGMTRDVALVAAGEPGRYTAEGLLFHMIGHWEFHVDVTRGPRIERAQASTKLEF
ncbi:hypothetical protein Poly30_41450 [Planctomycetes bacterium Poly30]|uniref:YtkA-like domain-containing protein n=1 Tax=Saltatorellus ferox TaxID=2528018 RepID=A0A518EWX4_9BACT|nr:hypothetical protein Poly30_41450 [Planctomycetes bacterium Poly30]